MNKRTTTLAAVLAGVGALAVPAVSQATTPTSEPAATTAAADTTTGDTTGDTTNDTSGDTTGATTGAAAGGSDTTTGGSAAAGEAIDLSGVCPANIVIQTDWFPEAEHAATYQLVGPDYTVDADNKIVSGPLYANGQPTGVDVEIRAGGPAIGADLETEVYADDSITMAYGTTDGQVLSWNNTPLMSVVAPMEINPQMIMWDPETYPDVKTLADLGTEGVIINIFANVTFAEIFKANGTWSEDQIDPSYDGGPSRFIAEQGKLAQQGFASAEPYLYEQVYTDWGKPVAFQTLHDAGFQIYQSTLAIRPDDLETLRPCLEQLVPIVQQAAVDYMNDPDQTNALIVDAVKQYNTFWEYPIEVAEFSHDQQLELGLTGNGPDDTLGNFDFDRLDGVLTQMRDADMDVPEDLTGEMLATNEFIDESIGL